MARTPKNTPILFPKAADVAFDRICAGFQHALDEADTIRHESVSLTQAQHDILDKNAMALEATYTMLKASYGRVNMDVSTCQTRYDELQARWAPHDLLHAKEQEFQNTANVLEALLNQPGRDDKMSNPQFIREIKDAESLLTERHKDLNRTLITTPFYCTHWRDQYEDLQGQALPILRKFDSPTPQIEAEPTTEAATLRDQFGQAHFAIFDLAMNLRNRDSDQPYMLPNDIPAAIDTLEKQLDNSMSALQKAYQGQSQFLETETFTYQGAKDTLEQIREGEGLDL